MERFPIQTKLRSLVKGYLESSNVNAIEELVRNIDMQRQFEINVKLIKKASDLDAARVQN
ncbi:MAG: flagellar basal body rod C-terminal domain-containing protein [Paracoccaceae bacterium]